MLGGKGGRALLSVSYTHLVILLLTLGILGTAMGCGEKKDKTEDKEGTKTEQSSQEDFKLTNKDGKVVAVDVDNIENYITLGEYKNLQVTDCLLYTSRCV